MSKDKQIKELTTDIYSMLRSDTLSRAMASMLYGEGYRKVSDTVQKMQDMVAVHFGTYTDKDTVKVLDVVRLLGKIAEEILEGEDG